MPSHTYRAPSGLARTIQTCPRCKARKRHLVRVFEWYSPHVTCCACGTTRCDGEWAAQTARERDAAARAARASWPLASSVRAAYEALMGVGP